MKLPDFFHRDLERLDKTARRRSLLVASGYDFSSNDYLALAGSLELRNAAIDALNSGVALGSGGSRLLRGNTEAHEALETHAADFFGAESALFTSSGYAANSLLFATLPQAGDIIIHDALVHASAHEGMRLSRAPRAAFAHNDVNAAADMIASWRKEGGRGTPWVAFETLYSMDGDVAPIEDFAEMAEREEAMLLIDEAHAIGVLGPKGRGLSAQLLGQENVIALATCGKAIGCEGALILGPAAIRDFVVNRGRSFIFSTAPSPLTATIVREALELVARADDRRSRLKTLVADAGASLAKIGIPASGSQIQPIVIGEDARVMRIASALQADGFDVRGIRPPSVPESTARLRISITLNVDAAAISALSGALEELL